MKTTTTLAITFTLTTAVFLSPVLFAEAEEEPAKPKIGEVQVPFEDLSKLLAVTPPTAPVVPKGTEMTDEIKTVIALINLKLIDPVRTQSNQRALMSRIRVRMDVQYHFAITDTSESLFPFDVYQSHTRDGWKKIASGVCSPGMESVKVAMPETGVMVDPAKHPLFALAFIGKKPAGNVPPAPQKAG